MRNRYIHIILLTFLAVFALPETRAQNTKSGQFKFEDLQINKDDKDLILSFTLDMSSVMINNQTMIELTPFLHSEEMSEKHEFNPIILLGKTRNKALRRELAFNSYSFAVDPQQCVIRKNGKEQTLPVRLVLPYEEWMRGAKLSLKEQISGCAHCDLGQTNYLIVENILPPLFAPSYEVQYVVPEAEEVKRRSETHKAQLNYKVGDHVLMRDFGNNAEILSRVDNIVREIRNDDNLTIQTLSIVGYASPEGNYNSNMELSKRRAFSFVDYLTKAHNLDQSAMKTDWKGEDWEGLRNAVESSSLTERNEIVRVIGEPDVSRRKTRLRAINNGTTYQFLLKEYYPPLRRNEYTISYVARAFNLEEAKDVIKSKPQHLSLNEMFLVANSYPKGSEGFNNVFDIAVRLYPDDAVANINAAAQEIENGALDVAIHRLEKISRPEALNNLGVAYAKKGDYAQATICFNKAAAEGNDVARQNEEQLRRALEN